MNAQIVQERLETWVKSNFELTRDVCLKMEHCRSVFDLSTKIANVEGMNEEDTFIAQVIAALHDCGRFPQIILFHTFLDNEIYNHSIEGAKLLENGLLEEFLPETREYDNIIIQAVRYHGLKDLPPETVGERTMMHTKLIRDADRTDIFERSVNQFELLFTTVGIGTSKTITPGVKKSFLERKSISVKLLQSQLDMLTLRFGLIGQYEFLAALELIEENKYIERLTKLFLERRPNYDQAEIIWLEEQAQKLLALRKKELA